MENTSEAQDKKLSITDTPTDNIYIPCEMLYNRRLFIQMFNCRIMQSHSIRLTIEPNYAMIGDNRCFTIFNSAGNSHGLSCSADNICEQKFMDLLLEWFDTLDMENFAYFTVTHRQLTGDLDYNYQQAPALGNSILSMFKTEETNHYDQVNEPFVPITNECCEDCFKEKIL